MKKVVELPVEKETPGTFKFGQDIDGRPISFYVPKAWLNGERPKKITLTVETEAA
jgi:hypothetical protein